MYRSGLSSQATRTDVKFGYSWPEKGVNGPFIFWRGIGFRTFEKFCVDNDWHNITSANDRVQAEPCLEWHTYIELYLEL